ncbi:F-box protein [Trifolium pratense]|uniref:Uncharacterized protein n=2 Tax=Trifolium pratense TaxID=57577 RepID=A0ACB0IR06_TRIPR|nr:F-box protein At2g35280-like [Trifolium pratense]PNX96533.1 F-box protein [Trifolium pratense]CAJ2634949.1 unnamed protein product [Trifolium pratense]
MASRIISKRGNNKGRHVSIQSLPTDLLAEVVATVASQSFLDLHNVKISCKDFLQATNHNYNYVLQKVSLDNFPLIQWFPNEKALTFLRRCEESENIEILFREGLREYFNYPNGNIGGLERLQIAAQRGHKEAMYVYGMLLLSSENHESRKQGIEHMRSLRMSKCIMSSRKKVQHLTKFLWKNNGMLVRNQIPLCKFKETCKGWRVKKGRWLLLDDEDDDIQLCEDCRWDHELEFFYQLFNIR